MCMSAVFRKSFVMTLCAGGLLSVAGLPAAQAATCRDINTVQQSAVAENNTNMGGHLTQHIDGMTPPPNTSQLGKTLFDAKGKYDAVWRQYRYVQNPVNCGGGGQAQQSVSLKDLGISYLGADSCTAVNGNGECTKTAPYMAKSVFFGFILKNGKWILNTAFPEPLQ